MEFKSMNVVFDNEVKILKLNPLQFVTNKFMIQKNLSSIAI
ncbi:hypothetical protein [Lactiplantibacillus plantarum]|nr:hypothetical protein [Lactiplantibacillus plantarum]